MNDRARRGTLAIALLLAAGCDSPSRSTDTPPVTMAPSIPVSPAPVPAPPVASPLPPTTPGSSLAVTCQAAPRAGMAPLRVEFEAFASGAGGDYAYDWSFGDGESSGNRGPSHTYREPGRFDAVVRVTSGTETASCARDIVVSSVTPPSPDTTPGPVPSPTPGPTPTPTPTPSPVPTPTPTPSPTPPPLMRRITASWSPYTNIPSHVSFEPIGVSCSSTSGSCSALAPDGAVVTVRVSAGCFGPNCYTSISGACAAQGAWTTACDVVMNADKSVEVFAARGSLTERAQRR